MEVSGLFRLHTRPFPQQRKLKSGKVSWSPRVNVAVPPTEGGAVSVSP